jgi:beta-alanine--pyruvate transaminase
MSTHRTNIPNSLNEYWMPFSANRDFKKNPRLITEAKGVYLKTHEGNTLIDASSGLFCNPLGHGREEIAEAVSRQLRELDFVLPFNQGFGGSFELATRIAKHTPEDLNKIFYTICGSTAVESAIKIAMAFHSSRGNKKKFRFVGRDRGYHGMNIGGLSVGGFNNYKEMCSSILMPGVQHMRHTFLPEHKFVKGQPDTGADMADDLETIANKFEGEIAACIVEPIAGSTGTLIPPKGYLNKLRKICDTHDILLIFDEVITGWGRTGSAFAAQEFGVTPDLMTMAKATTNGVVPMGVVAARDGIYDSIVNATPNGAIELFHGYTYSGIPVAVAAALAVQDIFDKENIFKRVKELSPYFQDALHSLKDLDCIESIRGYGMMGGIDIRMKDKPGKAGFQIYKTCYDNGVNLKATADALILAPPYICEKIHIDEIFEKLRKSIIQFTKQ